MYLNDKLPAREIEKDHGFKPNQVQRMLIRARSLVESGWWRGSGYPCNGTHCPITAIGVATDEDDLAQECCWEAFGVGALGKPYTSNTVKHTTLWNDAPERTKADVLAAFDKAIAYAGIHYPD